MKPTDPNSQAKDTGLALTLFCLLVNLATGNQGVLLAAIALLVVTMTWPPVFRPAAKLWFGFSHALGTVMSKVLLSVVFFLIVTPIGAVRRFWATDAMQRDNFKQRSSLTAFVERNHRFEKKDLEHPF